MKQESEDGATDMGLWCDIDGKEAVRINVGRLHRKKFTKNICSTTIVNTPKSLYKDSGYGYIMETPKQTASTGRASSDERHHVHVERSKLTQNKKSHRPKELPMHPLSFPEERGRRSKAVVQRYALPLPSHRNLPKKRLIKLEN